MHPAGQRIVMSQHKRNWHLESNHTVPACHKLLNATTMSSTSGKHLHHSLRLVASKVGYVWCAVKILPDSMPAISPHNAESMLFCVCTDDGTQLSVACSWPHRLDGLLEALVSYLQTAT